MVVGVVLWDIMGQRGFMGLLKDAYFHSANGIFAVLDITRKENLEAIHGWPGGFTTSSNRARHPPGEQVRPS